MKTRGFMTAEKFLTQEHEEKPWKNSCFAKCEGVTYSCGEIDQDDIFTKDQMIAFAEAYHQEKLKEMGK